jgi:Uma2 family endonuclease
MGMVAPVYFTTDMVRALPEDGKRYELVRGELLVSPAPRLWHQELVYRLGETIRQYLRDEPVGHLLGSPADISWGSRDTLLQPDLFVVPLAQARTMEWNRLTDLLLAVEVLSPSTERADRFTKRREYQARGVPLYLIVDGDARRVEAWTPDDTIPVEMEQELTWHPAGARVPFSLPLEVLFRPI